MHRVARFVYASASSATAPGADSAALESALIEQVREANQRRRVPAGQVLVSEAEVARLQEQRDANKAVVEELQGQVA